MFLFLLGGLAEGLKDGMDEELKVETKATFSYAFVGVTMPLYRQNRYVGTHLNLAYKIHGYDTG